MTGTVDGVDKALVDEGIVGVIAPDSLLPELRMALPQSRRVELVAAGLAKGLELDHVVVAEPAAFVTGPTDEASRGREASVRRSHPGVSRLTIVHTAALPTDLRGARTDSVAL